MVCLVVRGDLNSIDAIDFKIKNQIPVVVLKGSGAVSDLISFAFEELNEKYALVIRLKSKSANFFLVKT